MGLVSKEFGVILKKEREKLGFSQVYLEKLSKIGKGQVGKIEAQKVKPREDTAEKIAEVIGIDLTPYRKIETKKVKKNKEVGKYKKINTGTFNTFEDYEESFIGNEIHFEGVLKEKGKRLSDKMIIKIIDGGRLNKGFKVKRDGERIKGVIYNFTYKEIRKLDIEEMREIAQNAKL